VNLVTHLHLLENSWTFSPFSVAGNYNVYNLRGGGGSVTGAHCALSGEQQLRHGREASQDGPQSEANGPSEGHKTKPFTIYNNISAWCKTVSASKHQVMKLTRDMRVKTKWPIALLFGTKPPRATL
jgi:hypothetical protein